MKTLLALNLLALASLLPSTSLAQAPTSSLLAPRISPQDQVPGFLTRVYLNSPQPKSLPTHLVAVIKDGDDFMQNDKTLALDELRGVTKTIDICYIATGFIVLDKDTEIKFTVDELNCLVDGKDYGPGIYQKTLPKGKHTVEVYRQWGHGLRGFSIADATTGKPVVTHTGEQLTHELNRSVKIEGHTYKTKELGKAATAPK